MSASRLLPILGVVLLVLIVPVAMCVGLSEDDEGRRAGPRPPPAELDPAEEPLAPLEEDELPEEVEPAEAPLQGHRVVTGTVFGSDDAPLEGAEVTDAESQRFDVSDGEGRYRLSRVSTASGTLVVRVPGYAEARLEISEGRPDEAIEIDVALEEGDTVAGSVTDPDGKALAGASVRCSDRDGLVTESDDFGRFELATRAEGCLGVASHERYGASAKISLERGPVNFIRLSSLGSIAGSVVDGAGKPVTTFLLTVESFRPAQGDGQRSYRQTFVHPQGRFTISQAAAGTYVLGASAPRKGSGLSPAFVVEDGKPIEGVKIVLGD